MRCGMETDELEEDLGSKLTLKPTHSKPHVYIECVSLIGVC